MSKHPLTLYSHYVQEGQQAYRKWNTNKISPSYIFFYVFLLLLVHHRFRLLEKLTNFRVYAKVRFTAGSVTQEV